MGGKNNEHNKDKYPRLYIVGKIMSTEVKSKP